MSYLLFHSLHFNIGIFPSTTLGRTARINQQRSTDYPITDYPITDYLITSKPITSKLNAQSHPAPSQYHPHRRV